MTSGTTMAEIAALIGDPGRSNTARRPARRPRADGERTRSRRGRVPLHGERTSGEAYREPPDLRSPAKAATITTVSHPRMWPTCLKRSWRSPRTGMKGRLARRAASIRPFAKPEPVTTIWPAGSAFLWRGLIAKGAIVLTEDAGEVTGPGCDLLRHFGLGLEAAPSTQTPPMPALFGLERAPAAPWRPPWRGPSGAHVRAWLDRTRGRAHRHRDACRSARPVAGVRPRFLRQSHAVTNSDQNKACPRIAK